MNAASRVVGYSDRVNHAFAFAAKHHDRQVRKGTALPYLTHPASVAVILTRYGCEETTVLAGILHGFVEDCVREGMPPEDLDERVTSKFGHETLATMLAITERRANGRGIDLGGEERRADYLERLGVASDSARWVCAAGELDDCGSLLADLQRTAFPESVWGRLPRGPEATVLWHRRVYDRLREVGFHEPIMDELGAVIAALEDVAAATAASVPPPE
jgi:hypothetical protein